MKSLKKRHATFSLLFLILFSFGLLLGFDYNAYELISAASINNPLDNIVASSHHSWVGSYMLHPWKVAAPILVYVFVILSLASKKHKNMRFWYSCFSIIATVLTAGLTLFPFIVPSSVSPNESLTVWNATSSIYTLNASLYVVIPLLLLILFYKIFSYTTIWNKRKVLRVKDIKDNKEVLY